MNTELDFRLLRSFLAVAEELHFRRAAVRLHTTQSAVSQHVAELEARLGATLFARNRRGVALTGAGEALVGEARDLLDRADTSRRRVRDAHDGRAGRLTVGLIGAATFEAMPRLVGAMAERAPEVTFRFREMTAREQVAALRRGDIDAGLVRAGGRFADLALRTVMTEDVVCLLPEGHRLARRERVAIADLGDEPILNLSREYDPAAHDFYIGLYRRAGVEPRVVQEVSQIATILFAIAATGCVALGPASWRVLRRDGVVQRPLVPPVPRVATQLVWHPARVGPALAALLAVSEALAG